MVSDQDVRVAVFQLVAQIPRGKVSSYGTIGKELKINPRQVGRVLHTNTNPVKYPCHRVVHTDGSTATGYVFGGPDEQQFLLEEEGVVFEGKKAVKKGQFFSDFS